MRIQNQCFSKPKTANTKNPCIESHVYSTKTGGTVHRTCTYLSKVGDSVHDIGSNEQSTDGFSVDLPNHNQYPLEHNAMINASGTFCNYV